MLVRGELIAQVLHHLRAAVLVHNVFVVPVSYAVYLLRVGPENGGQPFDLLVYNGPCLRAVKVLPVSFIGHDDGAGPIPKAEDDGSFVYLLREVAF